jgi:hypothetical protein
MLFLMHGRSSRSVVYIALMAVGVDWLTETAGNYCRLGFLTSPTAFELAPSGAAVNIALISLTSG